RGFVVGSEGTVGIVTKILVRLTRKPEEIQTLLLGFPGVRDGAQTVSDIVAAGILPAAMEMMDQGITRAVEEFVHCGYPVDAGAVLLIEIDGIANTLEGTAKRILKIARDNRACFEKTATDTDEQALLWKGRKNAFGAVARIKPHYYLHDCVIPRTRLADVLDEIAAISEKHEVTIVNVFHAGDGNLHPLILFDRNQSGEQEKVELAGGEIIEACVAAGGTLSGEHGIGLEKMRYMPLVFTSDTLHTMQRIKCVFNPEQRLNPGKVLPVRGGCAEFRQKTS
ncbi:MAG: FAD-binding oxidoreductase, partial [Gammaproteobacteria bacterium]